MKKYLIASVYYSDASKRHFFFNDIVEAKTKNDAFMKYLNDNPSKLIINVIQLGYMTKEDKEQCT